jgi:hypothetical protein
MQTFIEINTKMKELVILVILKIINKIKFESKTKEKIQI